MAGVPNQYVSGDSGCLGCDALMSGFAWMILHLKTFFKSINEVRLFYLICCAKEKLKIPVYLVLLHKK